MYLCKPALMKNNGLQQADENQQLPDRLPDFLLPFHGHNGPIESIASLLGIGHSEMSAMPRRRMLEIVVYSSPADGKTQAKGGSAWQRGTACSTSVMIQNYTKLRLAKSSKHL